MKIVVTGALGNISKPLTETLVQQGHDVTVISSSPERQPEIEALGATAAIGALEDLDFLTATFTGADAVYCMVPPNNYFDHSLDLMAFYHTMATNYAQAIERSGVKRVVHLSSIGAHLAQGNGIIAGHYRIEQTLRAVPGIALTHMRPTYFYYNLFPFANMIKHTGRMASNYVNDDNVVLVSPKDIAAAIADEIVTQGEPLKVRYVASDERTCAEIAAVLGEAIGKPDLKWEFISSDAMITGLEGIGMSPKIAASLVEMYECMYEGTLAVDYYKNKPAVMGSVKLEDFAQDFAAAYNQK